MRHGDEVSEVLDRTYARASLSDSFYAPATAARTVGYPETFSTAGVLSVLPQDQARRMGERVTVLAVSYPNIPRVRAAAGRIRTLLSLQEDWDSYGADRIRVDVAEECLRLLAALYEAGVPEPSIVPTSQGGLQLEWHRQGVDCELQMDSPDSLAYYYADALGETREGPLAGNIALLSTLLARLTTAGTLGG